MASIFKTTATRTLPENADLVVRKGERFLRKRRGGKVSYLPLTSCGSKYREESRKWYIQYRDATGEKVRVAGYTDRDATLQLAAELERKAEHIQSGLADPHERGKLLPLAIHLADFRKALAADGNSPRHVSQTCTRLDSLFKGCEFQRWTDIVASKVQGWLAGQRDANRIGIKTSNYYLAALKQFCTWLETDHRVPQQRNPVAHLAAQNSDADVRWARRAISSEEFVRLIAAAESGPAVQCVSGSDRAMLYIMAAWTGYRREELASLTAKSFNLQASPPTVAVAAAYSKRRKHDVIPLHADVSKRLQTWLAARPAKPTNEPIFPLRAAKGGLRRTAKMMCIDLERARSKWLDESADLRERKRREQTDFLKYQNESGLYADFHANRHTFISNLSRAGVHPKMAQSVARHSDVNLTMGVYSHVELAQQAAAINALPAPPELTSSGWGESAAQASEGRARRGRKAGATEFVAPIVAPVPGVECQCMASAVTVGLNRSADDINRKPLSEQELVAICHHLAHEDVNSGGGIRTPDTRIMIPLL